MHVVVWYVCRWWESLPVWALSLHHPVWPKARQDCSPSGFLQSRRSKAQVATHIVSSGENSLLCFGRNHSSQQALRLSRMLDDEETTHSLTAVAQRLAQARVPATIRLWHCKNPMDESGVLSSGMSFAGWSFAVWHKC